MGSVSLMFLLMSISMFSTSPYAVQDYTIPLRTASTPCGETSTASKLEMDKFLQEAVQHFKTMNWNEIKASVPNPKTVAGVGINVEGYEHPIAMNYTVSQLQALPEIPVIAVAFGTAANTSNKVGLIWFENDKWYSQAYPNADHETSEKRRNVLNGHFCNGLIIEMHQKGDLLAVINDLGAGGTRMAHEVHLLKKGKDGWKLLWLPTYNNWKDVYMSEVIFINGMENFLVLNRDLKTALTETIEIWKLQGDKYIQISTVEL